MASVELHLQMTAQISFPDVNITRNKRTTIAFNQDTVTKFTSQLQTFRCTLTTIGRTMPSNAKDSSGKKSYKYSIRSKLSYLNFHVKLAKLCKPLVCYFEFSRPILQIQLCEYFVIIRKFEFSRSQMKGLMIFLL